MAMLTACGDSDDPVNIQTFGMLTSNRALSGDNVLYSQGSAYVELNYTDMTVQLKSTYKDAAGQAQEISTPALSLNNVSNTAIYKFSQPAANLEGSIDFSTSMMWYKFDDGNATIYTTGLLSYTSVSPLLYAYATTTVTNPDNSNNISHEKSAYLFTFDAKGESGSLTIINFIPNISGTIQASQIKYDGLSVTPTATGYNITASKAESGTTGYYTITDLEFKLDNQCRMIDGSFKCNDLDFTIAGYLFPSSQVY